MLNRTRIAFVLGSAFCTLPALAAHKIESELRADMVHTTQKIDSAAEVIKDSASELGFYVNRARINFRGDVTPNVSYRFRLNLAALPGFEQNARFESVDHDNDATTPPVNTPVSNTGGVTTALTYAYITHKLTDMVALNWGKQWIPMHTHEMYTHDWDEPMHDTAFTGNTPAGGYGIGVGATVTPVEGQEISLLLLNADGDGVEPSQSAPSVTAAYAGSFADGMVKPMVSYNMFSHREYKLKAGDVEIRKAYANSVIAAGLGVYVAGAAIEGDYAMVTYGAQAAGAKDQNDNSITATLGYDMNGIIPFARYSMATSTVDTGTKVKTTDNGISVGVRYKGADWGGLQYHAAFQTNTVKTDVAGAKETGATKIIIGAALRPSAVIKD